MTHSLPSGMIAGKGIVVFFLFLFTASIAGSATATSGTVGTVVVASDQEELDSEYVMTFSITSNEDPGDMKFGYTNALGFGTENVVVVQVKDVSVLESPDIRIPGEVIGPGEDKFFSDTVSEKDVSRYVRVSWEESSLLSLTVFPPDGELGPFLDTSDGREDQTIFLKIGGDEGISPGRWFYRVQNPKDGSPEIFSIETWEE